MVYYDVTDDVIMTSFNRVRLYSYNINPTKFGEDRMKNGRVIVLTSSRTDCTGNDVTDDVIMTKINRVLPYPPRNNPVKFHQDRIRFGRVIVFTSSGGDFTRNDVTVTSLMTSSLQKSIGFFLLQQGTIL